MKTRLALLAAACVCATAFSQQSNQPPQPGPEHKKLEIWLGDWTYETTMQESPLGPAGTYAGRCTVRPVLNGLFVEWRGEESGPTGSAQWTETDGYDSSTKRYFWKAFGSDGSIQEVTYGIDGNTVAYSGTVAAAGRQHPIRGKTVFSADLAAMVDQREISGDGRTWNPLWVCRFTKVKAAPSGAATVEQELIRLELAWAAASVNCDLAALDRLLADEATLGLFEGKWQTKAEFLDDYRSGRFDSTSESHDGVKARVYGDVAIVTGRTTMTARYNGQDASGQFLWTDTWVQRDGRWQCVASHGSKVAPPPTDSAVAEKELTQLEHDWARALVAADVTTLGHIMADEWIGTDGDGVVKSKAQALHEISSGKFDASAATASDIKVLIHGDTAIVIGLWPETATYAGKDASAVDQFTDTFIRRDGRWQCVASHSSRVPQK